MTIYKKTTLDKDLKKIAKLEAASRASVVSMVKIGVGLLFLIVVFGLVSVSFGFGPKGTIIAIAAVIGGYMALNIGANDVANNVGPAVGSKALTMVGALAIAAVCEASGALIAGGDVVATVSKSIVTPASLPDTVTFVSVMLAALLAGAIWVNAATYIGAPVSTTHAVVGGIMGAGIAASGWAAVNWLVMGQIVLSWIISPALGGIIAALFLYLIKRMVLYQPNRVQAAQKWVPILVGIMAGCFTVYLIMKGLKHIWHPGSFLPFGIGVLVFAAVTLAMRARLKRLPFDYPNNRKAIARLFVTPLIASAALLSFAHGANDVANAIGPLAAIVSVANGGGMADKVSVPLWVMLVGAVGIAGGLALFGPAVIRTVGEQITKLNPIRAFAVALSAAVTVIVASGMGLPVSSTHIAVGGVFGVGFLREYLSNHRVVPVQADEEGMPKKVRRKLKKRRLVRRKHLTMIAAAWVITVPLAAIISGILYLLIRIIAEAA